MIGKFMFEIQKAAQIIFVGFGIQKSEGVIRPKIVPPTLTVPLITVLPPGSRRYEVGFSDLTSEKR